jgi:hypothetical protein
LVEDYATGKQKVLIPHLEAQFSVAGLSDEDYYEGSRRLTFRGLPFDAETEQNVDPRSRMGVFDSAEVQKHLRWSDADHDLVVEGLRNSPMLGIDFVELEHAVRPAPWKGYDSTDEAEIPALIKATGTDPAEVIAYERENQKRPAILEAVNDLLSEQEKPVVVEA